MVTQQGRGERGPRGVLFYGYVEENEQQSTHRRDAPQVGPCLFEIDQEPVHTQRRDEEWQTQAERIGRQQGDTACQRVCRTGVQQARSEDGTDTRCPPSCKRDPDQKRTQVASGSISELKTVLRVKKIQVQDTHQVEPKKDDQYPSDPPNVVLIDNQHLSEKTGRGAERDEHDREAGNEQECIDDNGFLEFGSLRGIC